MKFDRSNKLDFCYYGQVNSLGVTFILLAMVQVSFFFEVCSVKKLLESVIGLRFFFTSNSV